MADFSTVQLRTVALVGHGGSGKTSLTEMLLARSNMTGTAGSVDSGTTVSDHDPLEKSMLHSLRASVLHCDHKGTRIHLIDTPGHPDFLGQSIGCLDAVETAAVVVSAVNGVELVTRRMMELARARRLCRLIIVNKIDHENTDLPLLVAELREAFGPEVVPLNLPADRGARVIDCFDHDEGVADFLSVAEVHRSLVEQVVEVDDAAMEKYLEDGRVEPGTLHGPLEQALRDGHIIPVCFVSARTGAGVEELLDVMVRHLPNPTEGNPPLFYRGDPGGELESAEPFRSEPDPTRHVLAHVFKIVNDPYVGRIAVFRVFQGRITRESQLLAGDARRPFKVAHLYLMQGKETVEVRELVPGDIGALPKAEEVVFDMVLHDSHDEDLIRMKPLEFPRPMFGLAIEPKRRGDEGRISEVLAKMMAEDPTLTVDHDPSQSETVIRGLSDLHLRTVLERMSTTFRLEVETRPPRVPYRETVASIAEGHARHKKQTGGAGQFGEVFLRIEPTTRGTGFEFVDQVKGGAIPFNLIPAVEKGVRDVLATGCVAGYPIHDVRVTVYDGKHHPVDSKEVAFVAAGRKAMLDAISRARPVVLEPIVSIEVTLPAAAIGDITGDLSSRRGQVTGTDNLAAGLMVVRGVVPLSELDGYAGRLKAVTQGQGSYSMELSHYEPVPAGVQTQLAEEFRSRRRGHEEVD